MRQILAINLVLFANLCIMAVQAPVSANTDTPEQEMNRAASSLSELRIGIRDSTVYGLPKINGRFKKFQLKDLPYKVVEDGDYEVLELDSECTTFSALVGWNQETSSCEDFLKEYFKKHPPADHPDSQGRYIRVNQRLVRLIIMPPDSFSLQGSYSNQFDEVTGGNYSSARLHFEYQQVRGVRGNDVSFRAFGGAIIDRDDQAGGIVTYALGTN